jgi:TM2 domain-containing membrane protein YozV
MSTAPDHPDSLRIGTAEREDAVRVLGEHFAEGRLTADEYEIRVSAAYEAENRAGLRPLFDDLPSPRPACLHPATQLYPQSYPQPYQQPYAQPAVYFEPQMSDKSKVTAGVLQLVFPFGVGRFYTGDAGTGVAQLLVTIFTCGLGAIWSWIDGIILLANGGTDSEGRRLQG